MGLGLTSLNVAFDTRILPPVVMAMMLGHATFIWPTFMPLPTMAPDGRFVPRWMRFFPIALYGLFFAIYLVYPAQTPPIPLVLAVFGMALISVASGIYRYAKRSTPLQKQQTKWFLLGMAIWLGISIVE